MVDFQQIKHEVAGRSVAIDSWYDAEHGTWQACAPAYSFLYFARPQTAPIQFSCRSDAVERLILLLGEHFDGNAH